MFAFDRFMRTSDAIIRWPDELAGYSVFNLQLSQ